MSIHAPVGVMIETRARAILHHLGVMASNNAAPGLFQGHIDLTKIGIAGHSRGGEAVVRAARINTTETLGWNLKGGISIAPTDYNHYGDPGIPLVVIYGIERRRRLRRVAEPDLLCDLRRGGCPQSSL